MRVSYTIRLHTKDGTIHGEIDLPDGMTNHAKIRDALVAHVLENDLDLTFWLPAPEGRGLAQIDAPQT